MIGSLIIKRVVYSSFRFGNLQTTSLCRGYLVNSEHFARISTGVTRYVKRWPFTHNFQPFNRMSQSVQNTTSSSAVPEESEKLSILQRFKRTYKRHGKILVGVHIVTSLVWYGSFYLTLSSGFDLPGFLESVDWSERVVKPFGNIGIEVSLEKIEKFVNVMKTSGSYAGAYLMYKIATPARYTVTLGGTNLVIRYLRKSGVMPAVKDVDRLGHLMKESRSEFETRMKKRMALERGRYARLKAQRPGSKKGGQLLMKAQEFYQKRSGTKNGTVQKQEKWISKAKEFYRSRKNQKIKPG